MEKPKTCPLEIERKLYEIVKKSDYQYILNIPVIHLPEETDETILNLEVQRINCEEIRSTQVAFNNIKFGKFTKNQTLISDI